MDGDDDNDGDYGNQLVWISFGLVLAEGFGSRSRRETDWSQK